MLLLILLIIICSLFVILSKNSIQSILALILVFLLTSILFLFLGLEFLSLLLLIVYVGAISILFLFVIMMLNLRIVEFNTTFYNYLFMGCFIGLIFLIEFIFIFNQDFSFLTLYLFNFDNYY